MCRIGKCSQWPHLYTTCEETYDLKQAQDEIFAKNRFSSVAYFSDFNALY